MPVTPVDNTLRTQQTTTAASPPMRRTASTQTTQEPADLKFLKPKSSTDSVSDIQADLKSLKSDFTGGTAGTSNVIDRISGLIDSLTKAITGLAGGTETSSTSSTTTSNRTAAPATTAKATKKPDSKKDLLTSILPLLMSSFSKPAVAPPPPVVSNPFASASPMDSLFSFNNNTSTFTGLFGGTGSGIFGIGDILNNMVNVPGYATIKGTVPRGNGAAPKAAAALGTPNALSSLLDTFKSGVVGQ